LDNGFLALSEFGKNGQIVPKKYKKEDKRIDQKDCKEYIRS